MSALLSLTADGNVRISGGAPASADASPTEDRAAKADSGRGDARRAANPNSKQAETPSTTTWEHGPLLRLDEWLHAASKPQGPIGLVLMPQEDPILLKGRLDGLAMIAVDFPKFADGRGYSTAALLRKRLGWTGELRAVGQVLRDQLFFMKRCGFDAFQLRDGQNIDDCLKALADFSTAYQDDAIGGAPVYRRRDEAVREAKVARTLHILRAAAAQRQPIALASSLSAEDQVLTDMIAREKLAISIFTLDTGRLHEDTVALIETTSARYGVPIEVYRPDAAEADSYTQTHGRDAFYESLSLRKLCCGIRKVAPLNRALAGKQAWITGQRRDQAVTRADLPELDFDAERQIPKYNPLADWTWDDVLAYARAYDVPINPLHAKGYVSIGCDPCTRAIKPGEDPRAGRWWWENSDSKECGLHVAGSSEAGA